jgi:hypothetical protein
VERFLFCGVRGRNEVVEMNTGLDVLKEVKYPTPKPNTDMRCPKCGGALNHGSIACPDGRPGCLVLHYGYTCWECGAVWQRCNAFSRK